MTDVILPYVCMLVPCMQAELVGEGDAQHYILTNPLTAIVVQDQPAPLAVYAVVAGGLGASAVRVEVHWSPDGEVFNSIGESLAFQLDFEVDTRWLRSFNLCFEFPQGIPVSQTGIYEFRLMCDDKELPGPCGEIRVIDEDLA